MHQVAGRRIDRRHPRRGVRPPRQEWPRADRRPDARATISRRRPAAPAPARRARAPARRRWRPASDSTAAPRRRRRFRPARGNRGTTAAGPRLDDGRLGQLRNAEQLTRGRRRACRRRRRRSWWCRDRCRSETRNPTTPGSTDSRIPGVRHGVGHRIANRIVPPLTSADSPFADVQLQLPAFVAVPLVAPELERADFGDAALERHRREVGGLAPAARPVERHLERTELLEVVAPVLDDRRRAGRSCGSSS